MRIISHSINLNPQRVGNAFTMSSSFLSGFIVFGKLQYKAIFQCVHNDATTIIE